ncbi:hypothetical protein AB0K14_15580 [Actinosynnema sp. NPDC050801]
MRTGRKDFDFPQALVRRRADRSRGELRADFDPELVRALPS